MKYILDNLQNNLNFTTRLFTRGDREWFNTKALDNGSEVFGGMFGDLIHGEADILLAPLSILKSRIDNMDFLSPTHDIYGALYIKNSKRNEDWDFFIYLNQIDLISWYLMALSVVLGALFMTITRTNMLTCSKKVANYAISGDFQGNKSAIILKKGSSVCRKSI